ncbi:MAG TPA: COX15/CtaA family protein, partial [Coxiellaceae bacterium]|nr:COX15/CtaA family protein [Coxiellaceae bacterium]
MYSRFASIATILAFIVVLLGAFTRLSDAGLGCPDWPGCYGKLVVPHTAHAMKEAQQTYPAIPLETPKAWAEMIHRYFAGTLGLFILLLAIWGTIRYLRNLNQPIITPWILVGLVIFQAALGMWTVTLKLLPDVVTAHLLGGMFITALLYWLS